jgi:hypothetical protein
MTKIAPLALRVAFARGINSGTVYKLGRRPGYLFHKLPQGINYRLAQRLVRIRLRHPPVSLR